MAGDAPPQSMHPKEIVHLSFGTPANHVATHFWNAQEAYMDYDASAGAPLVEHDVSFRAGVGVDGGATYTPRALFFDVRSAFGTLRQRNALYGAHDEDHVRTSWSGDTLYTQETVEPSWYAAQLAREDAGEEEGALDGRPLQYWSDYARCPLHPKSLVPVSSLSLHGSTYLAPGAETPFDTYEQGYAVAQAMEKEQTVMDENVRQLAEDTGLMQAFQVVGSSSDAFGGVTAAYLDWLADEYPKTERVVFSLATPAPSDRSERSTRLRSVHAMNDVLALARYIDSATMLVPMRTPDAHTEHVRPALDNAHHASAVLATYMETATLSTRLIERESWGRIVSQLNWRRDTRIAQLGGVFPTPLLAPVRGRQDPADALIDAMFAARNWHTIDAPKPDAAQGAAALAQTWQDCTTPYRANLDRVWEKAEQAPSVPATPYAETIVARDADPLAEAPTLAAVHQWNPAQTPFLHTYVCVTYPAPILPWRLPSQAPTPRSFTGLPATAVHVGARPGRRPRYAPCRRSRRCAPPPRPATCCAMHVRS